MTWATILSSFLLLYGAAYSKTLTLEDCIELALKNHPDIVGAKEQVKVANGNVWQAFGAFLPSISAGGSVSESHTEITYDTVSYAGIDTLIQSGGINKNYGVGVSASLTLFNGGQNIFNYLGSKADKSYYDYLREQTEQNLILTVKTTYFAYLAALKTKEIREEAVKRGEEQYKLASSRFEVGSASKSDVLKAKVQYGSDKLDLLAAENGIRIARSNLAYLIGVDVNSDIDFSTDYKASQYLGSEDEAMKFGLAHHPGLLAQEKNLQAAKYDVRSTRGQYFPTITVSLNRNWSNKYWHELNDFRDIDAAWSIQTSLNFTIFGNFSRKASMTRAKATLNNARADYYYSRNNVANEIKKAYLDMTRAKEALALAEENEAAAREDMNIVKEKYNLGAATILELLDAQVSLITAQNDKIQADFDYNLAVAQLENAMGRK
jgi:TolC family type I secretion outer membrane protein